MHFEPDLQILLGLAFTIIIGGLVVGPMVRAVGRRIPIPPPNDDPVMLEQWKRLHGLYTGGAWIGAIERPIFFAACWLQAWLLLSAWLVFKLAFYWQSANYAAYPQEMPTGDSLRWLVAKRQMGTNHVATALVGTGANIVLALAGVAIGKWVVLG